MCYHYYEGELFYGFTLIKWYLIVLSARVAIGSARRLVPVDVRVGVAQHVRGGSGGMGGGSDDAPTRPASSAATESPPPDEAPPPNMGRVSPPTLVRRAMFTIESVALAAFSVVGAQSGITRGLSPPCDSNTRRLSAATSHHPRPKAPRLRVAAYSGPLPRPSPSATRRRARR